jgi:aminopeptidase N
VWEQFFPSVQQGALASDSLANSHPIHAAVADSASVSEIFDAISYSKGASLILMTQQLVDSAAGEGTFRAALRAYLEAFRYGNAENADLFAAMDAEVARRGAAPLSLVARMQRWTNQQGFPLVTLAADGRGGLEARQQPFVFGRPSDANAQPAPAAEAARLAALWDVPLATKSASGTANLQWLDPRAEAQAVAGSGGAAWLRANTGQWAYVRVNYPEDSWRRLADAISSGESGLSVVDRMGLL